eukprot:TRINITY_DN9684_c0_g1_i1.p1 TRINITY_DN9684_c0_g1~~TRINITY_DN9684_c0_g1_i1.p1  ORF type:complete len:220 (-),score=36.27 TRINITY_DN9684_c0_g1_i1:137-796(-)
MAAGAALVLLHAIGVPFFLPSFLGSAPFVTTPHSRVATAVRLLRTHALPRHRARVSQMDRGASQDTIGKLRNKSRKDTNGSLRNESCDENPPLPLAVDLGSGDGRIVRALAMSGWRADGYELNPLLVWWSRVRCLRLPLARFHCADLFRADLSQCTAAVVYGVPGIMSPLADKLHRELPPHALVLSHEFALPPPWALLTQEDSLRVYARTPPAPSAAVQ